MSNKKLCYINKLGLVLSFFLPFILATNYTLNHFYYYGGLVLDSGWFAYLSTYAMHFPLDNPTVIGGSYFDIHFSPIFYLYYVLHQLLSWLGINLSSAAFLSLTQGFWFGILSLSAYHLILPEKQERTCKHIVLALIFSIFVMSNGVSLSIVTYPHFEIAIPALLIAFFSLWLTNYKKISFIPLILGLLTREDAGLHYFGIFILISSFFYLTKKKETHFKISKIFFILAIICVGYAISAIFLQKTFWEHNSLSRIYLGDPPLHHVTAEFIKNRLHFYLHKCIYIWLPIFFTIILAFFRKNLFLALGAISIIPWVTLSFFALSDAAGTLSLYYAFPLIIALLWPAISYRFSIILSPSTVDSLNKETFAKLKILDQSSVSLDDHARGSDRSYFSYWRDASIILLLSFFFFNGVRHAKTYPWHNFNFKWIGHIEKNQIALDRFFSIKLPNKIFIADTATSALELDKMSVNNFYRKVIEWPISEIKKIQVAIFLPHSPYSQEVATLIDTIGLHEKCYLKNSTFMIATTPELFSELCKNP